MMVGTFIGLSLLGATTIGGAVLERRFAEEGKTRKAKLIGDSLFHVSRLGSVCFIGYALLKVVVWFL